MTKNQEDIINKIEESNFMSEKGNRTILLQGLYALVPNLPAETVKEEVLALEGVKIAGPDGTNLTIEIPAQYFSN